MVCFSLTCGFFSLFSSTRGHRREMASKTALGVMHLHLYDSVVKYIRMFAKLVFQHVRTRACHNYE